MPVELLSAIDEANATNSSAEPNGKSAGPMTTDPIHLFDPCLKGLAGKPTQPVRLSPTTQIDVFLNALLETGTTRTVRTSPLE